MIIPFLLQRDDDFTRKEQMDDPKADPIALAHDLARLRTINRWFGGQTAARFTLRQYRHFLAADPGSILDVCCGSGDLTALQSRLAGQATAHGVDAHPVTLAEARRLHPGPQLCWTQADARRLPFPDHSFDLVTCHLALHHFSRDDATAVLRELSRVARSLAVLTDLTRSSAAWISAWLLVHLWMREPMTRHDALLSVRRAFNAEELLALAAEAGWTNARWHCLSWHRQALVLPIG